MCSWVVMGEDSGSRNRVTGARGEMARVFTLQAPLRAHRRRGQGSSSSSDRARLAFGKKEYGRM